MVATRTDLAEREDPTTVGAWPEPEEPEEEPVKKLESHTICVWCAGIHSLVPNIPLDRQPCPRLKSMEFGVGGSVIKVEFWEPQRAWELSVLSQPDLLEEE